MNKEKCIRCSNFVISGKQKDPDWCWEYVLPIELIRECHKFSERIKPIVNRPNRIKEIK